MKIQTSDCVQAIIEYFENKGNLAGDYHFLNSKMWKRLSKTGSGNSITRTFENKVTGDIVYVISSETEILSVSEGKSSTSKIKDFASFTKPIKQIKKNTSNKEVVNFVSAKPYLNSPNVFFCLQGRKEVVVECSPKLKDILQNLPSEYLQPRLKDIKKYLDDNGYTYTENYKGTTTV